MPGTSVKLYGRRKEESAAAGKDARLEALAGEDEGYDEYIPLKERRRREAERRAGKLGKNRRDRERARLEQEREEDERMASKRAAAAISSAAGDGEGGGEDAAEAAAGPGAEGSKKPRTLLEAAKELKKATANLDAGTIKQMRAKEEEHRMLKEANQVQTNALMSAAEVAKGTRYTEALTTSWRPPKYYRDMTEEDCDKLREKWSILVDGEKVPPPIKSFREMKLPDPMLAALEAKGIKRPTPIQVQGVPVALSGRDMIGIAFTGSGKTVTFSIPLIMLALEEEMKLPVVGGEGPFGVILCPSRELARQTFDVVDYFCKHLHRGGFPELRTVLCIGGEDKRSQIDPIQRQGVHCIVATPGRISDLLHTHKVHFDLCKYICLDEGDRMLDMGFDEEVQKIMNHFKQQRQTLLFSATMPQKFQDFAKDVLVKPVLVNVGRAGAANLDVIQEVEYVKQEAKIVYLLECLQKTAPPVCIFCEKKQDVDDIHEYLLLKGVDAVSIHGGKEQEERNEAIKLFKEGVKDVLIATDIAAKGLDFPDIQHVINFDMPDEIENYVHRIGRTGRCGKTGVATTFINKMVEESALLDLKHLLMEAQQRVPPVLMALEDPDQEMDEVDGVKGCAFCGGLGHRITNCPKIDKTASQKAGAQRDVLADTGGYGGDW
ncbi:DEAD box helicase [Ectocarpus siliculosus]|uniref:RNA helicase n=1 Tax=Ectocarpus siliculosus TaxID=2880 RepID=D8LJE9_ECTSI|nr:DEAD box helicase [Ectocarpus siliculosus]|eukprot:CBN79482.1 DEAD box helicase [Ectocarpus siliculosus]